MKYLIASLIILTSCGGVGGEFRYAEWVMITGGFYTNQPGQIEDTCLVPGYYRVRINGGEERCINHGDMRLMEITDGNG